MLTTTLTPSPPTVKLTGKDSEQKRTEIRDYFISTFDLYERLFSCINDPRAWTTKAITLRHPLIFYYAHTATFYINKLLAGGYLTQRLNAKLEAMMAIGVDEMSWDDLDESHYDWPSVEKVTAYRQQVKARVLEFIDQMPLQLPIDWSAPAWIILMGIEHERIHLETSSVLIRQLPIAWVTSNPDWPSCPNARQQVNTVPENQLIPQPGGEIVLGKQDDYYGWDNEYGEQTFKLASFSASKFLVSNAEFLTFIRAGGYITPDYWDKEGWQWRNFTQAQQPSFWVGDPQQPTQLRLRLMTEEIPMAWDWPVEVNQLEAMAFCRWKSAQSGRNIQLPCEAEWYQLREQIVNQSANINLTYWASSCPIDQFPQGEYYDIVGNVWQWTTTPISGFPGFKVHPLYDDFSTPTFDGRHNLIKGGSWISTGNEALKSARYAFRRHFFQHAGFRYVESNYQEPQISNPYETDEMVSQYLDFQYGPTHFGIANYAQTLVEKVLPHCQQRRLALDIGCATGRASFELSHYFESVIGIDYSARFVDVAQRLSRGETFGYQVVTEGELTDYQQISLVDDGLVSLSNPPRFIQGDACNLKPQQEKFDLVFAANLIDRLPDPAGFLRDISRILSSGGILLIASPYTWLEDFTPRDNWLGGIRENGEVLTSYQGIQRLLAEEFSEVLPAEDVSFVIRETARKFQHTLAQLTIWKKR